MELGAQTTVQIDSGGPLLTLENRTHSVLSVLAGPATSGYHITLTEAGGVRQPTSLDYDETREFLMQFLPQLSRGPKHTEVQAVVDARRGKVTIAQLRAHTTQRARRGLVITGYGIFSKLADDCVASADAWTAAYSRAAPAKPERDIAARMAEFVDRLERAGPEFAAFAKVVRRLDFAGDVERFYGAMSEIHARIVAAARETLTERIPDLRRAAARELERYRERMTDAQWKQLKDQVVDGRLLELLGLPLRTEL